MFDFAAWIPFWLFTDTHKQKYWRALYIIKTIRILYASHAIKISTLMAFIKNRIQENTEKKIKDDPVIGDDIISDHNNINTILNVNLCLKVLQNFILICNASYFVGLFWYLFC